MTTLILRHKAFGGTSVQRLKSILAMLNLWLQRCHQRRQLARLDDRLLRDIGLDRDQVRAELAKPFWK